MIDVTHTRTRIDVTIRTSEHAGAASCERASLLPCPASTANADALGDAMAQLYALMSTQRESHAQSAMRAIERRENQAHAELQRELDALRRAESHDKESGRGFFACIGKIVGDVVDDLVHLRASALVDHFRENVDEAANSPRFWAELERGAILVAKVAAIVGSAVGTIATFGAAGPVMVAVVIGVALSGAAMAQDELHFLEKLGVDKDVARWTSFGASIAGSVIMGGAGASAMLAGNAGKLATAAHAIQTASSVVSAGAQGVAAAAHVECGEHAALAEEAQADRTQAQHTRARLERAIAQLIETVKDAHKSAERKTQALMGALQTHNDTLVLSSARG